MIKLENLYEEKSIDLKKKLKKAKILIVEDERITAYDIEQSLKELNYEVAGTVSSGEDVIHMAEKCKPDLILMDIKLNGEMTGIDASKQIHDSLKIPVVFLTANSDLNTLEDAKKTEPYGFLPKPFSYDLLHSTINIALYKHNVDKQIVIQNDKLQNRNRELNLFFSISSLIDKTELTFNELLQSIIGIIPEAWSNPEDICAKAELLGQEYKTNNFKSSDLCHSCEIFVFGNVEGTLSVCNLGIKNIHDKKNFDIKENLIRSVAERIGHIAERNNMQQLLNEQKQSLELLVKERTSELINSNNTLQLEIEEKNKIEKELRQNEEELRQLYNMTRLEMRQAINVQRAFLPSSVPVSDIVDIAYKYIPMRDIGGDYLSFTSLREGGIGVFIGDVSGHGVSAALYTSLLKLLSDKVCRKYGSEPQKYIKYLNLHLMNKMQSNFVSGIYGLLKKNEDEDFVNFTFAKAGHPYPILYKKSEDEIEIIETEGRILGLLKSSRFEKKVVKMSKGDRLFLCTDGITETINHENDILNFDGLGKIITNCNRQNMPIEKTLDLMMEEIELYRGKKLISDDVVLIGIEAK